MRDFCKQKEPSLQLLLVNQSFTLLAVCFGTGKTATILRAMMIDNKPNRDHSSQKAKMFLIISNLLNKFLKKTKMETT
jgi:hypothetical protein